MRRFPSSWNATLAKLGLKLKKQRAKQSIRRRSGGYGRRASLEQLESRELLTGTPWAGTELVVADFDGDGNPDRLRAVAGSTSPEVWSIDTKSSAAAGMVEDWRVTRSGAVPAIGTVPAFNQLVVGDFNGDGRDDMLARTGSSSWYMIQSRVSTAPATYQGDFVISSWGTVSTTGGWSTPVVGDFNGDGRDDVAAFNDSNSSDKQWQVMTSTGTAFNLPATWASLQTVTPTAGTIVAGDFNGDGRDDLLLKKSATSNWAIAVSDGSRFNVLDPAGAVTTTWTTGRKGNFDGDGGDELLGWNSTWNSGAGRWETLKYDDHRGMSLDVSWGNSFGTPASNTNVHVGDANRDGRDDLVVYSGNKWNVALSQASSSGTNSFEAPAALADGTNDWDRWFKDWDWGPTAASYTYLNVDAPYQKFLDVFSDVYNTVELELYPGLMKGIEATDQTNAGNDWDQAALLVERLEPEVQGQAEGQRARIATGKVLVNQTAAKDWIGTTTDSAAFNVIDATLDGNADVTNGKYRFKHAWVLALVPTADGLKWVDVDPSWKFKDRQPGETVDLTNSAPGANGAPGYTPPNFGIAGRDQRGTFDEFGYLANGGTNQLPVEWYEDQVMKYLVDTGKNKSLADVPFDGPIIQKQFDKIPFGWGDNVTIENLANAETFANFAEIENSPSLSARLTHQATVSVEPESVEVGTGVSNNTPADFLPVSASMVNSTSVVEWYLQAVGGGHTINQPGPIYVINGTDFIAVPLPSNYVITPNTRLRFDFSGVSDIDTGPAHTQRAHFVIGFDVPDVQGANPNNSGAGEHTRDLDSLYTTGTGTKRLDFRVAEFLNYSTPATVSHIVLGLYKYNTAVGAFDANAYFSNLSLYENDNTSVVNGSTIRQIDSATAAINLATPYTVTASTRLEFEFKSVNSTTRGQLHAIGWDTDADGTNDATVPYKRYRLDGTDSPTTYPQAPTPNPATPDGFQKYSISIGSHLTGGSTASLQRLLFITGAGTNPNAESQFRNVVLVENGLLVSVPITIPAHSLDSIKIDYAKAGDTYTPRIAIGSQMTSAQNGKVLHTGEKAIIHIQQSSPSDFGIIISASVADIKYDRKPGQIHAIGFDANQYSSESIVSLQAGLNSALLDGASVADIDELLSYTAAKYWYELTLSDRLIDGLMRTVGAEEWVGSGIVTSDPYLLTDSIPNVNLGDPLYSLPELAHLQFPILPYNMGIDLPNSTHSSFYLGSGTNLSDEAFYLGGYNGSALENAILEEVVDSESISTIRGLQNAYKSGSAKVWVYESIWDTVANQRKIYQRGSISSSSSLNTYSPSGGIVQTVEQVLSTLTSGSAPHLPIEASKIAAILENKGGAYAGVNSHAPIRVSVPDRKSVVGNGNWSGSVYVAEYDTLTGQVGAYIIAPDGGTPTNGGYSGNQRKDEVKTIVKGQPFRGTAAGDPVNVANGNMFRDEVDFTFANPIIPLDFARHYDSQNKLDVGFGVGWVHGFTGFIYEEQDPATATDKDYVWLRGNGERHTFEDLNFTLPNTLFGDIQTSVGPGGSATDRRLTAFLDRDGTKYIFEPIYSANAFTDQTTGKQILGRLVSIQDATGIQGVNITYESANSIRVTKVASISSPSRYLQFVYNANNSIDVKRFEGSQLIGTWAYVLATHASYSGKRLTQVKHADQTSVTSTTTYDYFDDGPASRRGLIKKITEPNGESHSYEYYANGRVFRVTDGAGKQQSFNYNLFRNLTEFTDENGNVETYIHQDNGLLTKQIHDDRSRLEFTWGPQSAGSTVQWEEFLMQTSTDERGAKETFDYNDFLPSNSSQRPGELRESTAKDGVVTRYTYKSHDYISAVEKIEDRPQSESNFTTRSQFTYDVSGHVLTETDAEGHTTTYEYYSASDPAAHLRGLRKSETLPKGVSSQTRAPWESYEAVPWETLTDSLTITGNTISIQLLTAAVGQFVAADAIRIDRVDKNGVFTRIIDSTASGSDPNFRFAPGVSTSPNGSSDAYGAQYLRISGTNPEQVGATWIFRDLELGTYRISASWQASTTNSALAKYHVFEGLPDGAPNQVVSGINQQAAPDSFRSYQTIFQYDSAGNVTRAITEGLPAGRRAYDSFGNVVYEEDATGVATVYTYDALGRLTKSTVVDPQEMTFTPGPAGNVKSYHGTGGWDVSPNSYEVRDGGDTLYLFDGARKGVALNYQVTTNTVLEFDFEAVGSLGEFQAIAISHSLNAQAAENFALAGTRNGDWPDIVNWQYHGQQANSGPKHYRIPIGTHVPAGLYQYLAFINQDTGTFPNNSTPANEGKSYFSNVRIYESTGTSNVATTTFAYDASGRLKTSADALGRTTSYAYDKAGRLVKTSFADGTFTAHEYDEIGNCVAVTDELDRTTRYVYDDRNRLIQTIYADGEATRTRYDGAGQIIASIDERNYLTQLTYDKAGRLLTTTAAVDTADQTRSVNKYDSRGRLVESVDGNGIVTKYKTDNLGRVTQTTVLDRSQTSTNDLSPVNLIPSLSPIYVSTTEYDSNGNVGQTAVFDPLKFTASTLHNSPTSLITAGNESANNVHVVRTTIDAFGRQVKLTNADGTSTSTIYDAAGRARFTFDELGRRTEQLYDVYGRLDLVTLPDPDGIGPGRSPQTDYLRDYFGNVIRAREYYRSYDLTTVGDYDEFFAYDTRNRLTVTTRKDNAKVENVYDVAGQLVGTVDAMGNATYIEYDERGRVITQRLADPDGSGSQFAPVTTHEYDAAGNIIATTDPLGNTTEFTYDALNRLKKESHYDTQIADDSDSAGDASFAAVTPLYYVGDEFYGRDTVGWTAGDAGKQATWTFSNVVAGSYRVAMTWRAHPSYDDNATITISVDGVALPATSVSQRKKGDFTTIYGDRLLYWTTLDADLPVSYVEGGATLTVRITANGSIMADAVRIDRLVSTAYTYDKTGNLRFETDTRGYVTEYSYDELGRQELVATPDPDRIPGTTTNGSLASIKTESLYDGYGNVIATVENRGTTATTDDRTNTFDYDRRNRLTKEVVDYSTDTANHKNITTQYEHDDVGNTTLVTDAEGFQTRYRYDNLDRLIDEYREVDKTAGDNAVPIQLDSLTSTGTGTISPPVNNTTITVTGDKWIWATVPTYSATHQTILEFDLKVDDLSTLHLIGFDTDSAYSTSEKNRYFELGGVESLSFFYNTDFRRQLPLGETITFHIPIGQYLSDSEKATGLAITRLAFRNYEIRTGLSADDVGKSIFSNVRLYESDEVRTVTTYDTRGNVETVREASDPRKITTRYKYDVLGRQSDVVLDSGGSTERVYRTFYDANGNVTGEESPTGATTGPPSSVLTVHDYDRLNRLIKTTLPDPDGNAGTYNGLIDKFTFDVAGNVIKAEHGFRELLVGTGIVVPIETTYTAYDQDGRVTSEFDGNGDETRYRYDSAGNLLAVTDAEQNTTRYTYDGLNRLWIDHNDFGDRSYTYSPDGTLKRIEDRDVVNGNPTNNRRVRQFLYDTLDRPIQEDWKDGAGTGTVHLFNWQYDKLDRVTKQVDSNTSVSTSDDLVDTFRYDGLGRLVEQRNYDPATASQGSSSGVPRVRQTYEYEFRHESASFHDRVIRNQYSHIATADLAIAESISEFDRLGRIAHLDDLDADPSASTPAVVQKSLTFSYDTASNLTQISRFIGPTTTFGYDKADRLTSISYPTATPITHAYTYDNASRVTSFDTTGPNAENRGYTYDNSGQLTSRTGEADPLAGEFYSYDDNGNRLIGATYNVGPHYQSTIGAANRLTEDVTYTYLYDNEGNLTKRTSRSDPALTTEYVWDHRNRLTSVIDKNGTTVTQSIVYTYDAQGRRVKRAFDADGGTGSEPIQSDYYIYDGDELSMTYSATGAASAVLEHRYLHGPAGQALVDEVFDAAGESWGPLWLLGDQQGSIRDILDGNGTLRKHVDFDSFGRITDEVFRDMGGYLTTPEDDQAVDQAFAYTGQERDETTGLQLHGKRWYNPDTGRWLSEDPSGFDGGDPNLYRYVHNNPVIYVDPTGLTQAGNPLTNLFAGGYSGNTVTKSKPVNPFVASASSLVRGAVGTVTAGLGNLASGFNSVATAFSAPSGNPILQQMNAYSLNQTLQNLASLNPLSAGTFSYTAPDLSREAFHQNQLPKGSTTSHFYDSIGTRLVAGQTPSGQVYYFDPATGERDFRQLQTITSEAGRNYQVFADPGTRISLFDEPTSFALAIDAAVTLTGLKGVTTAAQVGKVVSRELAETARDLIFEKLTGLPYVFNFAQQGRRGAKNLDNAANGITIRNSHLAGQFHPVTKVPFDKHGFPDFSNVATKTVTIKQVGNYTTDIVAANKAAGLKNTPAGYTWHHHQNGKTMQLVPRPIHEATGHTGGVAIKKAGK